MKRFEDIPILHNFGIATDLGSARFEKVQPKPMNRKMVNAKCISSQNGTYIKGNYYFILSKQKCSHEY